MRTRVLIVITCGVLVAMGGDPTAALGDDADGGDGGQPTPPPLVAVPKADPATVLTELENLAGASIAAATNNPDTPFTPLPTARSFGPDGTAATEEGTTRLENGGLVSEIVLSAGDVRAVATVTAKICPDEQGHVSAKITLNIDDRTSEVRANGVTNDDAVLTQVTPKGKKLTLLERKAVAILEQAEHGWRNGYCVRVEVSEGQSQLVKPKQKVPITAIAKPRFDGGEIKGRMEAKKTAGQKKVEPATVSASPAKFTYTAPDKRPETGSVRLKSVSRRGIGTANLEYTTEGDLKVDAVVGPGARVTAVKCGGPIGQWNLVETISLGPVTGSERFTFTIVAVGAPAAVQAIGDAQAPGAATDTSANGSATYTESPTPGGTAGTLALFGGSVPVTVGTFCTNGAPPSG